MAKVWLCLVVELLLRQELSASDQSEKAPSGEMEKVCKPVENRGSCRQASHYKCVVDKANDAEECLWYKIKR